MNDLETKLNQLLSDPSTMEQISALAKSLGAETTPNIQPDLGLGDIDLGMIQKLSGLAGQSNIDKDQKGLLNALSPYLSHHRIEKLEKAMRAAKMARLASGILPSLTGR